MAATFINPDIDALNLVMTGLNWQAKLTAAMTASQPDIPFSDDDRAYLLSILAGDKYSVLVIDDCCCKGGDGYKEAVTVWNDEGRLGIARGVCGTKPHAYPAGARVFQAVTPCLLADLIDAVQKIKRNNIFPQDIIPYAPFKNAFPPLSTDRYTFLNDAQQPLWDDALGGWHVWALVNFDATFPKKTPGNNTFINGGSSWGHWLLKPDFSQPAWLGTPLNKGLQSDGKTNLDSIATGSCVFWNGKYHFFASTGDNLFDVSHWAADDLNAAVPQYQGVVMNGKGQPNVSGVFRDPHVAFEEGRNRLLMSISIDGGWSFYASTDGVNWTYLSSYDSKVDGFTECARWYYINGAFIVVFGANNYKHGVLPISYYSTGKWDGTTYTECHRDVLDYGYAWYGACLFSDKNKQNWFQTSWVGTWNIAANSGSPYHEGSVGFRRISITGSACVYNIMSAPVYDESNYKLIIEDPSIDAYGDYTTEEFNFLNPDCNLRRHYKTMPKSGTQWVFGGLDGEHNFDETNPDDVMFGYHPLGVVLTKTDNGFTLTCRNYGVKPYEDIQAYQKIYNIPQPAGDELDLVFRLEGDSITVFVSGNDLTAYYAATLIVNWEAGAIPYFEFYTYTEDSEGSITAYDHYDSSMELWAADFPPQKCGGGLSYRNAKGMFLDASTPAIVSNAKDAPDGSELRIKKANLHFEKGLLLRRFLRDTFDKSISVPTLPVGAPYRSTDTALISLLSDGTNLQLRHLAMTADTHRPWVQDDDTAQGKAGAIGARYLLTTDDLDGKHDLAVVGSLKTDADNIRVATAAIEKATLTPYLLDEDGAKYPLGQGGGGGGAVDQTARDAAAKAQSTADTAQSTAESADSAAQAAQTTADTAKTQTDRLKALAFKDKAAVSDIDASGEASDTTYLRGDGAWGALSGGGSSEDDVARKAAADAQSAADKAQETANGNTAALAGKMNADGTNQTAGFITKSDIPDISGLMKQDGSNQTAGFLTKSDLPDTSKLMNADGSNQTAGFIKTVAVDGKTVMGDGVKTPLSASGGDVITEINVVNSQGRVS